MIFNRNSYPQAVDPIKVGQYPAESFSGGGYVYDEVLEYRVWSMDSAKGYQAFPDYSRAKKFYLNNKGYEPPLVLVLQKEHINEEASGKFVLVKGDRLTEWQPEWLKNAKRTKQRVDAILKRSQ